MLAEMNKSEVMICLLSAANEYDSNWSDQVKTESRWQKWSDEWKSIVFADDSSTVLPEIDERQMSSLWTGKKKCIPKDHRTASDCSHQDNNTLRYKSVVHSSPRIRMVGSESVVHSSIHWNKIDSVRLSSIPAHRRSPIHDPQSVGYQWSRCKYPLWIDLNEFQIYWRTVVVFEWFTCGTHEYPAIELLTRLIQVWCAIKRIDQ